MDLRKPIPCPGCDNPEMNQGSVTINAPLIMSNKWCECGCRLTIVTAGNEDVHVTAKIIGYHEI